MEPFKVIEPETETHRTEKALESLVPGATLPLTKGSVAISVGRQVANTPTGQHLLVLLVHLLGRMKGIVCSITIEDFENYGILPGIPLMGTSVREGLGSLINSLNSPLSEFKSTLYFHDVAENTDFRLGIGSSSGDLNLGADAWRALLGSYVNKAQWNDHSPLGPYMAAVMGASEVFKKLLQINFGWKDGKSVENTAFSLFNYGIGAAAEAGPDIRAIALKDLAVAGCGAGGTAALYTLGSFTDVSGEITAVEPGNLKKSNLNRYLMSDSAQVHSHMPKLDSVQQFFLKYAPKLTVRSKRKYWAEVNQKWNHVIATVDTPEARRDVQRSDPETIIDAGVLFGTLYTVLRVVHGGWCLECKHPFDPDIEHKKRALRWGLSKEEVKLRYERRIPVTQADIRRLATVQARPIEDFLDLDGVPFDEVPALTECGETPLSLSVPSQAPVLPLGTTAAGIVLAAETVKNLTGKGVSLNNYFVHDLRYGLKKNCQRFKPRVQNCPACKFPDNEDHSQHSG